VHVRFAYLGPAEEGERLIAPMRGVAPIVADMVSDMPYAAVDAVHMDPVDPMPAWERGTLLSGLPAEAVETILAAAGPGVDIPIFMVEMRLLGGALGREAAVPNAAAGRDGAYSFHVVGPMLPEIAHVVPQIGRGIVAAMEPFTTGSSLLNFLGDATTPEEVGRAYRPEVHRRLMDLKSTYDPGNVFRYGHALGAGAPMIPTQGAPTGA